jgi:hypothetical protein
MFVSLSFLSKNHVGYHALSHGSLVLVLVEALLIAFCYHFQLGGSPSDGAVGCQGN